MQAEQYEDRDVMIDMPEVESTAFRVDDDKKAEWAIKKIAGIRAERDRLVKACEEQIGFYQERMNRFKETAASEESYFISLLMDYFDKVPHKTTKTLEKYTLPSGSLVLRRKPDQYEKAETLLNELQIYGAQEFIKIEPSVKWADLKEKLIMIEGKVNFVTEDGEILPLESVKVIPGASVFEVKL